MQDDEDDRISVSTEDLERFMIQQESEEWVDSCLEIMEQEGWCRYDWPAYIQAESDLWRCKPFADDWTLDTDLDDDLDDYLMRGILESPDEETSRMYYEVLKGRMDLRYWKLFPKVCQLSFVSVINSLTIARGFQMPSCPSAMMWYIASHSIVICKSTDILQDQ